MRLKVGKLWTKGMKTADGPFVVEVDGQAIVAVEHATEASTFDLETDLTALPGYVDCHEHIGIDVGDEHAQSIDEASRIILKGTKALRQMIEGGVTTIRDCGERADVEPYWAEALRDGTIAGPRLIRSITPICRTGGHAWYLGTQTDGPDALRAAVRKNVRTGADFIKIMATGGMGTIGSSPGAPEFTVAELEALVDEAHRLGRKVAAHAHGGAGVDQSLDVGVDSIEHGCLLTEDQLRRMVDLGTTLVVTMGVGLAFEFEPSVPAPIQARMGSVNAGYRKILSSACELGVRLTVGSDCVHGGVAAEMGYLVEAGFSTTDALVAGTAGGADLLGRDDLGELTPGRRADLVLVDGDPVADIGAARRVVAVMTDGRWQLPLPARAA
jgi:imidazolonepropionase-like amidohydrolase